MARSPTLALDDATRGTYGDVAKCAAGRWTIRAKEVRFLSPQHHLLKSEQEQEKRERCKLMDNTMRIPRGH
jgi:hypothetical protein